VYSSGQEVQILLSTYSLPCPHIGISPSGPALLRHKTGEEEEEEEKTIIYNVVSYSI
jgi:hypothetical protein